MYPTQSLPRSMLLHRSLGVYHGTRRSFAQAQRYRKTLGTVLDTLAERGLIHQVAGDRNKLDRVLHESRIGAYAGIDPTAPSLHVGHLLPFMVLFWLYHFGHDTVSLVGGATARVGDPTGRLVTRKEQSGSIYDENLGRMSTQLAKLWDNAILYGKSHQVSERAVGSNVILDNSSWLKDVSIIEFLETLGNGTRIGAMLGRDTVKNKLANGDGMSFAEFSYPLLQGWDWLHMYRNHGVVLQIGGGDQYGNIIAGIDVIQTAVNKKTKGVESSTSKTAPLAPMGITVPLLTTASGVKFGKSAGNAVWLDQRLTTAFDLYGFFLGTADADVEQYLKLFTFLSITDISSVMSTHLSHPERRTAQHLLAKEILELVHGTQTARDAQSAHECLKSPSIPGFLRLEESQKQSGNDVVQFKTLPASAVIDVEYSQVMHEAGIAGSRAEAARMIRLGGLSLASRTTSKEDQSQDRLQYIQIKSREKLTADDLLDGRLVVLKIGKWKLRVIRIA